MKEIYDHVNSVLVEISYSCGRDFSGLTLDKAALEELMSHGVTVQYYNYRIQLCKQEDLPYIPKLVPFPLAISGAAEQMVHSIYGSTRAPVSRYCIRAEPLPLHGSAPQARALKA
jgi:hypothetical protein